ncbi:hypothetical protein [Acinetobacter baumannii]|uniref:hypothetical protein n=1 Tax=Acinetobacter baumannii TaxID=470 RepID=UPI000DE5F658|nr:hypothetical protein [Acinetobacter baumannii]SSI66488.1 Uncharacterised protein [Acinetobacter baumannii]
MKCIAIERTVDAWHVEALLIRAKEDFSTLPAWVKKMHQENKFLIGGSSIRVHTRDYIEELDKQHVLFRHDNGDVEALLIDQFYRLYKDPICG